MVVEFSNSILVSWRNSVLPHNSGDLRMLAKVSNTTTTLFYSNPLDQRYIDLMGLAPNANYRIELAIGYFQSVDWNNWNHLRYFYALELTTSDEGKYALF